MSLSPNSNSLDPFQQFFETRDHVGQVASDEQCTIVSPYEVAVLHCVLATSTQQVDLPTIFSRLVFYLADVEGGEVADVGRLKALIDVIGSVQKEKFGGDLSRIQCTEIANELVQQPEKYFARCSIEVNPSATPETVSYLTANEGVDTSAHEALCRLLLDLDTLKDGVMDIDIAYREIHRTLSTNTSVDCKRITKMILSCSNMNEMGQVSLSDFIELYAMSVFVIPKQYSVRCGGSPACSKHFDLSDYSLLWAALMTVEHVPIDYLRGALTDAIAVEGVVNDDCSLEAVVTAVMSFVGTDDVERRLGELMDLLVREPTRFTIPMMAVEDMQQVMVRKLCLYCPPEVQVSILHTLLLLDAHEGGCVSKSQLEAALFASLRQEPLRSRTPTFHSGTFLKPPFTGDASSQPSESPQDMEHLEELLRSVLLCLPHAEGKGQLETKYFIDLLLTFVPVTTSQFVCDYMVPFDVNVPLAHVVSFLKSEGCARISATDLRKLISLSIPQVDERVMDSICDVLQLCSLEPTDSLYDVSAALQVAVAKTCSIIVPIRKLPPYTANVVARRLQLDPAVVRSHTSRFVEFDVDKCGFLDFRNLSQLLTHRGNGSLEVAQALYNAMDIDGDGRIGFQEYLASLNRGYAGPGLFDRLDVIAIRDEVCIPQEAFTRAALGINESRQVPKALPRDASLTPVVDSHLKEEFRKYDLNGNGFLDRKEFSELYRNMENFGVQPSARSIESLFNSVCGSDSRVSYNEFCVLMLRRSRM